MNDTKKPYLRSSRVRLRTISRDDYREIYGFRTDPESLHFWKSNPNLVAEKEFYDQLDHITKETSDLYLVITQPADETPIGIIHTYDTNILNGYTFGSIYITPPFRHKGITVEAAKLFLTFLFDNYPIRKLYAEIDEFNTPSHSFIKKLGFFLEGEFDKHRYFKGKYWKTFRYSVFAEQVEFA